MDWFGVLLVNGTSWFRPPSESLNAFYEGHEYLSDLGRSSAADDYAITLDLSELVQDLLTSSSQSRLHSLAF